MSDTPRTDAASAIGRLQGAGHTEMVRSNFARELERELNELVEDRDYYESSLRKAENLELNLMKEKADRPHDGGSLFEQQMLVCGASVKYLAR